VPQKKKKKKEKERSHPMCYIPKSEMLKWASDQQCGKGSTWFNLLLKTNSSLLEILHFFFLVGLGFEFRVGALPLESHLQCMDF
jgi:hypothetical protein